MKARALVLLCGCVAVSCLATPRPQDAPAPRDYFHQAKAPSSTCEPRVEVLRSAAEALRPYREVATLSASCYPGTPRLCEDRLAQRACELKADAVILMEPTSGGTPPGSSGQSEISMSGRAVRWNSE
ncbi:MAG TPA: hypothetical protein VFQ35_10135 [Polyangiaceae bacterium]|nr:hypothetical protein [Polyangiaceae bacterium]